MINKKENKKLKNEKTLYLIKTNGKYGYIDNTGEICIEPVFEYAGDFIGPLAVINVGEKFGFIDKDGEIVTKPVYDDTFDFSNGFSIVQKD